MDDTRKKALRHCHPNDLREGITVNQILPRLHIYAGGFLTEVERDRIKAKSTGGNVEQVDELVDVLVKKENKDFDHFCYVLEKEGYLSCSSRLKAAAGLDQSGLKAIEYPMKGSCDMSLQLSQGSQAQVAREGGTSVVCVSVPVLKRKHSRLSASSGDNPCCPAEKRTMDEYMKMKMDLERQDMKSVLANGDQTIRLLYANALGRLEDLLNHHLDSVKNAADTYIQLGLHEEEEKVTRCDIQSAESVRELFSRMSIKAKWDCTIFLQQAVDAIPAKAREREVAEAILSHYDFHLAIYRKATVLKDNLAKEKKSEKGKGKGKQVTATSELVSVEITSSKSHAEFTCENCHHLQIRFLSEAIGIPPEEIICLNAVERQSTTVTFLVPNRFTYIIMQRSTQLETVWIFLELDIIEVAISGFTFNPSFGCFLTLLRGSKSFTADLDLLRVTEILPYLMHCLVDPGSKEPLSGLPLGTKRIAQHRKPHEDVEPEDKVLDVGRESVKENTSPSKGNTSPKVEEEVKTTFEGKEKEDGGNELQSHVHELEDALKTSETQRWELIHGNAALQIKLKASRQEEGRILQELASLREKLLPVLRSQVEQPSTPRSPPRARPQPLLPPSEQNMEVKLKELAAQVQQIKDEMSELELENSDLKKMLNQQVEKYDHDMEAITQCLTTSKPITNAMLKAVANFDPSMVQLLIKRIVNVEGKNGWTPVLLAAEKGHADLVRNLAEQYEGDIFHKVKNSQNALHLAAYRGHLPVLQYLCPMFGDRVLDRDGNNETCLDIAHRLGRRVIAEFLARNYPQLEGKSDADKDSQLILKRARHHRWWLKVSDRHRDIALPSSFLMEQTEGNIEIVGEVEFRRDPKSSLMKAVSGTEWMYRRLGLDRGSQVAATTLRLYQFTRCHQRWLADHVQEEEEESCQQWLLHQSPEVTTVRVVEEYRQGRIRHRYTTEVKHPTRSWKALGTCKKVIQHNAEGDLYKAVAVNSEGLLALVDAGQRCVHILTKEGKLKSTIGRGMLGGFFQAIYGSDRFGVSFDLKGNVLVCAAARNSVVKLSQDGELLQTISYAGRNCDFLKHPWGVCVSPEDQIYICDHDNHSVTVHKEDGRFLHAFGVRGNGPGCYRGPRDVAFGSDGNVYVIDEGKKVCVWSKEGDFQREFKTKHDPFYIAATGDNHLLITSRWSHTVMVYTLEGELVHEFGRRGSERGRFDEPLGICIDDSGMVYVADCGNKRVQVF